MLMFVLMLMLMLMMFYMRQVVYASRDIAAGEELNDSYIELRQTTAERRKELMQLYRFHCTCPGCAGESRAPSQSVSDVTDRSEGSEKEIIVSDDRSTAITALNTDSSRVQAKRLDEMVMSLVEEGEEDRALACALELLNTLQDPVNTGWRERFLAEAHLNVFHIARSIAGGMAWQAGRKYRKMASEHLGEAHRWNVCLQGERSEDSVATRNYLDNNS
jgi:hypothetical protein